MHNLPTKSKKCKFVDFPTSPEARYVENSVQTVQNPYILWQFSMANKLSYVENSMFWLIFDTIPQTQV